MGESASADGDRPVDHVRAACRRFGEPEVAVRSAELLSGASPFAETGFIVAITGRAGASEMGRRRPDDDPALLYWPRVWGARALLYAWDDSVAPVVVAALTDDAWRVREMAAKVVARRELGAAADALARMLADPVPRVRAAAARALAVVGEAEHAPALAAAVDADADTQVRHQAEQALHRMSQRLDRDLT